MAQSMADMFQDFWRSLESDPGNWLFVIAGLCATAILAAAVFYGAVNARKARAAEALRVSYRRTEDTIRQYRRMQAGVPHTSGPTAESAPLPLPEPPLAQDSLGHAMRPQVFLGMRYERAHEYDEEPYFLEISAPIKVTRPWRFLLRRFDTRPALTRPRGPAFDRVEGFTPWREFILFGDDHGFIERYFQGERYSDLLANVALTRTGAEGIDCTDGSVRWYVQSAFDDESFDVIRSNHLKPMVSQLAAAITAYDRSLSL